jgi:thiol-disulfide isomerase/thioredoxin
MKFFKQVFICLLLALPAFVYAQNVKFENAKPEAGSVIKFTYDPTGTKLAGKEDIQCYAYVFHRSKQKVSPVKLIKENTLYTGEIQTADSTSLVALQLSSDGKIDENAKGYYTLLYKGGKQTPYTYLSEAILLDTYGVNLRMNSNQAKASLLYKQAFDQMPELKKGQSQYRYFVSSYNANPVEGRKLLMSQINKLSKLPGEQAILDVMNLYTVLKETRKVDSVKKVLLIKFPTGTYAWSLDYGAISSERDLVIMETKVMQFKKKFGYGETPADVKKMSPLYERLASAYAAVGNYEKFDLYAGQIVSKVNRAGLYNSVAWPLAEKNQNSIYAAGISKSSLELLDAAKDDEYPFFFDSKESYLKNLQRSYAMYADTYALILHNMGNDKEAVVYQEKAGSYSDADGNERYVMYLDLSGNKEKAFKEAALFLEEGRGTDAMRERLKSLYNGKGLNVPFETYIVSLEKPAKEKEHAEWVKKMINIPAPDFSLLNIKGERVSLADLKGKIVILDYWATWCGPCVASFPGMQKAVNKYADDPNVVFLFINTRQTESNREELVKKFIADNKYTFNVLYDTKSKQDPSKFDLINAYEVPGIPTKFIIDGSGNIRFKVVGFSGSADGVVKEIDTMIGLVNLSGKTGK